LVERRNRTGRQPPADLIRSATTTAARLLNLAGEVGVVAPGAYADLLVVDGNPLDDIRVLSAPDRNLKLIMKEGRVYKNELGLPADAVAAPRALWSAL
jgi:imidazolonepropionase-like amidohydrolase